MPPIRSTDAIAAKWAAVTPGRAAQYEAGIRNPIRDYAANAQAAATAWRDGVQAAIQGGRFAAGVRRVGNAKWQRKAIELGPTRYGTGVQAAQQDYATAFAPFRDAIERTTLPARGPRRSPQNLQRVNAMVTALSAAKEAQLRGA